MKTLKFIIFLTILLSVTQLVLWTLYFTTQENLVPQTSSSDSRFIRVYVTLQNEPKCFESEPVKLYPQQDWDRNYMCSKRVRFPLFHRIVSFPVRFVYNRRHPIYQFNYCDWQSEDVCYSRMTVRERYLCNFTP